MLVTIPDAPRDRLDLRRRRLRAGRRAVPLRPARGRPRPARRPRHASPSERDRRREPRPIRGDRARAAPRSTARFAALPVVGHRARACSPSTASRRGRGRRRGSSPTSSSGRRSRARSRRPATRRGAASPIFFKSLYAYVIAPFWAIHSTADRVRGDQVHERRRDDARGGPDLPARADDAAEARVGARGGARGLHPRRCRT